MTDSGAKTPTPQRPSEARSVRVVLYAYAALLMTLVCVHLLFTNRVTHGDEHGLYNAIYMYQHHGKVTYPAQNQFSNMTVHPPTHYFVVGVLVRLGLDLFLAAGLPLVVLVALTFTAVMTSAFRTSNKFAVLTGVTLGVLVYTPLFPIRPDMHATLAWTCGMLCLEASRSLRWESRRLAAGAFCIAYGSAMHYWALAAVLVLPAYLAYIVMRPAGSRPATKALVLAAGALVFYIPWALFFVIPDFHEIVGMITGINATGGGTAAAIRSHMEQLRTWTPNWPLEWPALGRIVFWPVTALGLPPLLCAVPVLFAFPSVRGLAFPGALLPLFVLTMVSRKAGFFYIAPELMLYATACALVLFAAVEALARWIRLGNSAIPLAGASLLCGAILARSAPFALVGVTGRLIDWDVARAANVRILGNDALVALNNCYEWYSGGGARVYWIVTQPVESDYIDQVARRQNPDSFVLINDSFANQRAIIPFPSFYADGHLNLRGFYFAGRHGSDPAFDTLLTVLHTTARKDVRKEGFGFQRGRRMLNHYIEDPEGPWVFVSFKGYLDPSSEMPEGPIYFQRFEMEPAVEAREPGLYAFVIGYDNWLRQRARYAARYPIRDEVRMRMEEVPAEVLLANRQDRPIEISIDLP